jgi:hypothetical protein
MLERLSSWAEIARPIWATSLHVYFKKRKGAMVPPERGDPLG